MLQPRFKVEPAGSSRENSNPLMDFTPRDHTEIKELVIRVIQLPLDPRVGYASGQF